MLTLPSSHDEGVRMRSFGKLLGQSRETYALTVLLLSQEPAESKLAGLESSIGTRDLEQADASRLLRRLERVLAELDRLYRYLRLVTAPLQPKRLDLECVEEEAACDFAARLRFIHAVDRTIRNEMGEEGFGANQLASGLAMSRAQLYRKFEAFDLPSPAQLILQYRLEHACTLLRQDDLSVTSVAFEVGFNSLSHFSRTFRARFGQPPSEWRSAKRAAVPQRAKDTDPQESEMRRQAVRSGDPVA